MKKKEAVNMRAGSFQLSREPYLCAFVDNFVLKSVNVRLSLTFTNLNY